MGNIRFETDEAGLQAVWSLIERSTAPCYLSTPLLPHPSRDYRRIVKKTRGAVLCRDKKVYDMDSGNTKAVSQAVYLRMIDIRIISITP